MILVFDLDDTLYPEITFIKNGFRAVSNFLSVTYGLPSTFQRMLDMFTAEGRNRIFDKLLAEYHLTSVKRIRQCVSIYRYHKPDIILSGAAQRCLGMFSSYRKYIVTDGNSRVQANKINALNIRHLFTGIYITRNYGIDKEKPSPYCFLKIQQRESVPKREIVYIGDNSNKDFVEIKKLGFRTVRIRQGFYKDVIPSDEYEAEFILSSLDELNEDLLAN